MPRIWIKPQYRKLRWKLPKYRTKIAQNRITVNPNVPLYKHHVKPNHPQAAVMDSCFVLWIVQSKFSNLLAFSISFKFNFLVYHSGFLKILFVIKFNPKLTLTLLWVLIRTQQSGCPCSMRALTSFASAISSPEPARIYGQRDRNACILDQKECSLWERDCCFRRLRVQAAEGPWKSPSQGLLV